MYPTNYIYIFEDGRVIQNTDEPVQDNADEVDAGILTVLKTVEGVFYQLEPDMTWIIVPST